MLHLYRFESGLCYILYVRLTYLVEMVDTLDLKSSSFIEYRFESDNR